MAPEREMTPEPGDADIAKAFQELARGEQAASAMENQLTALEQKIDALLASAESAGSPDKDDADAGAPQTDGTTDATKSK
ncbi:MAG: hypothetical protein Q9168_000903 [Polycauliona sp. 1 TL-2023]